MGEGNRGFHWPISDRTAFAGWPQYVTQCIFVDDPTSFWYKRVFDHVIYLHGSTCVNRVGMTMTFAHELQHVIQRIQVPELLTANGLFRHLPKTLLQSVGLQWSDIPTEREARAVAKEIAVTLHGSETVRQFLAERASAATDPIELADVQFIQELDTSTPYLLRDETLALFARFKGHRWELESLIEQFKSDPDFEPVDLDLFMPPWLLDYSDRIARCHGLRFKGCGFDLFLVGVPRPLRFCRMQRVGEVQLNRDANRIHST